MVPPESHVEVCKRSKIDISGNISTVQIYASCNIFECESFPTVSQLLTTFTALSHKHTMETFKPICIDHHQVHTEGSTECISKLLRDSLLLTNMTVKLVSFFYLNRYWLTNNHIIETNIWCWLNEWAMFCDKTTFQRMHKGTHFGKSARYITANTLLFFRHQKVLKAPNRIQTKSTLGVKSFAFEM